LPTIAGASLIPLPRSARQRRAYTINLTGIGDVNPRVADAREASKRFYRDMLGFWVADEDPEYGGVFTTVGDNFHTLDIGQYRSPDDALRPLRESQ
jgi:catechol-2,3-dioxygenase